MNGDSPVIMQLTVANGRAAVVFNDGDIFFQDEPLSLFLMHLSILIPEEWDTLEIKKGPERP